MEIATLSDRLEQTILDLSSFSFELGIIGTLVLLLLVAVIKPLRQANVFYTTFHLVSLVVLVFLLQRDQGVLFAVTTDSHILFGGMLQVQSWSYLFKLAYVLTLAIVLVYALITKDKANLNIEYQVLMVAILLGASLLTMSNHLLMVYLSVELLSIASYALVYFGKKKRAAEAAMKYLLFGAVSSALMVYGMSWLYGLTGSMNLTDPQFAEGLTNAPMAAVAIAALLTLTGFLFKIGAVPFHIWIPDVYQSAPLPVVGLFSVVPKLAALVVLGRFLYASDWQLFLVGYENSISMQEVLIFIAIVTMTLGNVGALAQRSARRMLAFSSIGHSGILIGALALQSHSGMSSLYFYAITYLLMNLAVFFLIQMLEKVYQDDRMELFSGWGERHRLWAILTVVLMVSLTGLPPTLGFTAKLLVFSAWWEVYSIEANSAYLVLLIAGLVNTVIALFYYLKIPYFMYFRKPLSEAGSSPVLLRPAIILYMVLILPLLYFFFRPSLLVELANNVTFAF
ncbi:MAG: NADH-quinone oxidoreductase subunit N [Cyclobacteriaceae bacterium]|nr:NADH-quinone oxidoreductase subunit N [Cyclobacteriaceae bacterium]MCH8515822.1 NADH-quinone oxidoreductase subunit N [Cyclobacteriaceae bacterium]